MPVGHAGLALHMVEFVSNHQPINSVLDLGVGYGLTGAILRNYFGANPGTGKIWPLHEANSFRVHGVEVFPTYRNPLWDLYQEVVVGRIEDWLHLCPQVDAVICNDVFEHIPKDIGREILKRSKKAFVGVCQVMGQGTVYGNPHEAHTTPWTEAELREFCDKTFELNPGYVVGIKSGSMTAQIKTFWAPRNEAHAKELIGPVGWRLPAAEYTKELFDSDEACSQFLKSFKKKKPDLLEIGCGMGRILREVAPVFGKVYGLDISDGMLKLAEPYLKGSGVKLGKIIDNKFPLDSESIDLAFSIIVFQHIQERSMVQAYLREVLRVLRPGGLVRVQTHKGAPPPEGVFGGFHGHFYASLDSFAAEFSAAGFEVVGKQQGVGYPEWLWVTARKRKQ